MMSNGVASVFMVAGSRLLRETLTRLLKRKGAGNICGVSPSLPGVASSIADSGADVLILDSAAARLSEFALISEIRALAPNIKVVLIDMEDDPEVFLECVRAGAVGYVLKDASACEIVSAIQAITHGEAICPAQLCMHLFRAVSGQRNAYPSARIKLEFGLTRRQQQLVPYIAQGLTNKEIAAQLNISEQTVKNHVHELIRRVGASDRLQVVELTRVWGTLR
jgi:DNA-binding NarL/FixJ family response regulator